MTAITESEIALFNPPSAPQALEIAWERMRAGRGLSTKLGLTENGGCSACRSGSELVRDAPAVETG